MAKHLQLESAHTTEILSPYSLLELFPQSSTYRKKVEELFISRGAAIIINLWVAIFMAAGEVVQLVDPSLVDIKYILWIIGALPMISLWLIVRLNVAWKILKTSFEPYYIFANFSLFGVGVAHLLQYRSSVIASLIILTLTITPFLALSDSQPSRIRLEQKPRRMYGLVTTVSILVYEGFLLAFANRLNLGYDFSNDDLFQIGDIGLTVSGITFSCLSAVAIFSVKNFGVLYRDRRHLLLVTSRVTLTEISHTDDLRVEEGAV